MLFPKVTKPDNSTSGVVNKTVPPFTGQVEHQHTVYRVHTFLSSGNFVVPSGLSVQ